MRSFPAAAVVALTCLGVVPRLEAQTVEVLKVQEKWELVLLNPDSNSTAPQVTCAFTPLTHTDTIHAAFELNHRSQPEFEAGGMQLQIWDGEVPHCSRLFPHTGVLAIANETVTWTQMMEVANDALVFEVVNGTSETWGSFGGQGYLKASVPTTLTNLNSYNPAVSANASGIGYAANRVASLKLLQVKLTLADGSVLVDDTDRIVWPRAN